MKQPRTNQPGRTPHPAGDDDAVKPQPALTGDLVMRGRARASLILAASGQATPAQTPERIRLSRQAPETPTPDRIPSPSALRGVRQDRLRALLDRDLGWWITWCAVFFATFIVGLNFVL